MAEGANQRWAGSERSPSGSREEASRRALRYPAARLATAPPGHEHNDKAEYCFTEVDLAEACSFDWPFDGQ